MAQHSRFGSRVAMASGLVAGLAVAAGTASADQGKRTERREASVVFTSATAGGEATLVAEGYGVIVEKRTAGEQATIVVRSGADRVTVALSAGEIRVARGGRERRVSARSATRQALAGVRQVLAGSEAVSGARRMKAVLDAGVDTPSPILSALAFVGLLSGDAAGMQRIATAAGGDGGIRFARYQGAEYCWTSYGQSVSQFWEDRESCLAISPWNPVMIHACNFEWTIKAEIAWFSLIACAGGLPSV